MIFLESIWKQECEYQMKESKKKLPIGIEDFKKNRTEGFY